MVFRQKYAKFAAAGAELMVGGNSCLQTYYPQRFRLTNEGLIAQEDFCLAITEIKTGSVVCQLNKEGNYRNELIIICQLFSDNFSIV